MGLAQDIRNAYDFRDREMLERACARVDKLERGQQRDMADMLRRREDAMAVPVIGASVCKRSGVSVANIAPCLCPDGVCTFPPASASSA